MRRMIFGLCVILCAASNASGWSAGGHKIVASIAFRQLSAAEQAKIIALLKKHPRFAEDFSAKMPDDIASADEKTQNDWIFQQAAIWPDIARGLPQAIRSDWHRSTWHYINRPLYLTDADRMALSGGVSVNLSVTPPADVGMNEDVQMNVVQTIRLARKVAKDSSATDEKKAWMLSWIFHTVGDIHQPMHSSALYSRGLFPQNDRGGNSVATVQRGNLHSAWDGLLGGNVKYRTARNKALSLIANSDLAPLGQAAAMELNEEKWLDESAKLASGLAYDEEVRAQLRDREATLADIETSPVNLSEDYFSAAGEAAERRVVQAGFRLGALLKQIAE